MSKFETRIFEDVAGVPSYTHTLLRKKSHRYALVLPVLNENGRLQNQLALIHAGKFPVDIVIADGGSTDNATKPNLLFDLGVTSLLTKTGPGKLSAQLRMAFSWCLEQGYLGIITMDGNNKDGPEGIVRILEALEGGFDFVQGSRFIRGGTAIRTPIQRLLAIRLVHAPITSLASRHWFTDTTNGFRGHSKNLLSSPQISIFRDVFNTYELIAYFPIAASKNHFRVKEVPVRREYPSNGAVPTKIVGIAAQLHILKILMRAAQGKYNL